MKRIKPEELPRTLTPEVVECLAQMANEYPKSNFDWVIISDVLEKRGQLKQVLDRAFELHREASEAIEEQRRQESYSTDRYAGNMGAPDWNTDKS